MKSNGALGKGGFACNFPVNGLRVPVGWGVGNTWWLMGYVEVFRNDKGAIMDVRIFVETVFEGCEVLTHDVGQICRQPKYAGPENLGLHLAETKRLLKQLQETILVAPM